ncbi:MAG: cytochrome c [Balneolaceae bacterium]|nr:cytochrome c [Balneolaceae bacterium]
MTSIKNLLTTFIFLVLAFSFTACGGEERADRTSQPDTQEEGLTEFELEHGIGPITEKITLDDELDPEKIEKGRNIYEMKCEMCHNMQGRMVGPPLAGVTETRTPEFIMNFILNPRENIDRHPVGQALLREYLTQMPYQNVSEEDARALVEFMRDYDANL